MQKAGKIENTTQIIMFSLVFLLLTKLLTCLIAVTVMTNKSGSPLVTGLVGVSIINCNERNKNFLVIFFLNVSIQVFKQDISSNPVVNMLQSTKHL